MLDIKDIPAPWYMKALIWIGRIFRRFEYLRPFVRAAKDRAVLGVVARYHINFVHELRKVSINAESIAESNISCDTLESLADGCRDVMADILEVWPNDLHCTMKLCEGEGCEKEEIKVYTIARSQPCKRPAEYGLDNYHLIGNNSSFASIVGCGDRRNKWTPHAFTVFVCGDLTKESNYDDSRGDWKDYYRSTMVFPLRIKKTKDKEYNVFGFLTFDSYKTNALKGMPNTFRYITDKKGYDEKLSYSAAFHIGGSLADSISTIFYPAITEQGVEDEKE